MRGKIWCSIVLCMFFIPMFLTASCARKMVQTEPIQTTQPEVKKAPDIFAEEAESARRLEDEQREQPRRLEDERLRAEKAAREAARAAFVNENIHFDFDSAILSGTAQLILKRKADYLRVNSSMMVTIEGHCDERGTVMYNIALGEQRAVSVKKFLIALGIDKKRLGIISYGEEKPLGTGHDEASWAMNRRAQFVIN